MFQCSEVKNLIAVFIVFIPDKNIPLKYIGATTQYRATFKGRLIPRHYCFRWSAFFKERSRTQYMLFLFNDMQISGGVFRS